MSASTPEQAMENIYISLQNNNEGLDAHIETLKSALGPKKEITVDATRLPVPNREGRKMMQTYFKKRGLSINFEKTEKPATSV